MLEDEAKILLDQVSNQIHIKGSNSLASFTTRFVVAQICIFYSIYPLLVLVLLTFSCSFYHAN